MNRREILLCIALSFLFFGCKKEQTIPLTLDNRGASIEESALGPLTLNWDVAVVVNGVDFGVIEGGTRSVEKEIPLARDHTFVIDSFVVVSNNNGRVIYGTRRGNAIPVYSSKGERTNLSAAIARFKGKTFVVSEETASYTLSIAYNEAY